MASNLDTAIRIVAKVSGLNDFKGLADTLKNVEGASKNVGSGLQQVADESGRVSQQASRSASTVKLQAVALQGLQAATRASATAMRGLGADTAVLGSSVQKLRNQSNGVFDGIGSSASKSANNIRQLQISLQPTEAQLAKVRSEILQLGDASKQTERSIEQQVAALKNLRSQADVNGNVYKSLSADLRQLQASSQAATVTASASSIRALKELAKASAETASQQTKQMSWVELSLAEAGEGYRKLGREIDSLKQKAAGLDLSKGLNITPASVVGGVGGAVQSIVQMRRDLAKSMAGRVVLTGEGLAAAGVAGAAGAGAASGLGGLAGGAQAVAGSLDAIAAKAAALPGLLKPLGGLLAEPTAAAAAGIAQWSASLAGAQAKIAALSAPMEAIGTAISAIGPEASAAAGVASLAIAGVYQVLSRKADEAQADLERSFKGISDNAQQVLQNLVRLYDKVPAARLKAQEELRQKGLQRLGDSPIDSLEARQAANAVVTAEREIAKIKGEQKALIEKAREQQNRATEELKKQRDIARERLEIQRKLTAESRKTDEEAIKGSIRRHARDLERDQAYADRQAARAAAAYAPSRTMALPAAGQSSFQGVIDGRGFGGGARAAVTAGKFERPLIMGVDRPGRAAFGGANDYAGPQFGVASNGAAQAAQRSRGALAELFITIDRVTAASNGSISSLQRQRGAWEALRTAVNPAAPAYAKATAQVKELDQQLTKLTGTQQKARRSGIGGEALGSALGTLATGGGLQGAVGALSGGLAFSGGPAGLIAGAGVAAIGGAAMLASRVGVEAETAQVRLKALTDQFGEYTQAQAAAARIAATLRISQVEASDGFSKLYAALRPTGITLKETEDAFVGFTAAARASGATAEESSAALLQLKQALGSGVLQGDELRSIREQAPAVGQAIAKEMGVTIGELKKLGSEGKITTDIVIRALAKLRGEKLGQLQAQFSTSAQAMKDLQVASSEFGVTIARVFGPSTVAAIRGVTAALQEASVRFGAFTGDRRSQNTFQDRIRAQQQAGRDLQAKGFNLFDFGGRQQFMQQREAQLFQQYQQARVAAPGASTAEQQQARAAAAAERQAARTRAAAVTAKSATTKTTATGPDYPAYISKEVLRDFLRAQGFDRTSGDFTNRGHRTPNHMLNAMDMGVLSGPYDQAVLKTAAMKRRLAATGAFGNQLFGPGDPGHADHLHVPTPGGRVRVTPGLAKLMGLGGKEGLSGDVAEYRNQAADRADQERQTRADQLAAARDLLFANQANLRIAEAKTPLDKAAAEYDKQRAERMRDYADRLTASRSEEERRILIGAQTADQRNAEISYQERLRDLTAEQADQEKRRAELLADSIARMQELTTRNDIGAGFKQGLQGYADSVGNLRDNIASLTTDSIGGLAEGLANLNAGGSENYRQFAANILRDTSKMIIRQLVLKAVMTLIGFIPGGGGRTTSLSNANLTDVAKYSAPLPGFAGGGYTGNGARSGGMDGQGGFMALLHPRETVVDHSRGQSTGGTTNISINVDASGTRAQGDDAGRSGALARDLAGVVDQRLVFHKRPGGLLNP
jgi:lambda family phage tail tape measure protein